jgi:tetratricopeptide (TPR) repeat protein
LGNAAQVLESLANVYLARGESEKALASAREAVNTFKRGDDRALLSEALVTLGKVYARLGQSRRARKAIAQAVDTSELAGDSEGAGSAALTLLEELFEDLTAEERQGIYTRAEVLLSRPMNPANVARLREMSIRVVEMKSHRGSLHFIELPQ